MAQFAIRPEEIDHDPHPDWLEGEPPQSYNGWIVIQTHPGYSTWGALEQAVFADRAKAERLRDKYVRDEPKCYRFEVAAVFVKGEMP